MWLSCFCACSSCLIFQNLACVFAHVSLPVVYGKVSWCACRSLPFVINHFTGSRDFNRALRYWANTACKQEAQKHNQQATGFHLSDSFLCPAVRLPVDKRPASGIRDVGLGTLVPASCETDIFHAMGLAYVPASMRFFGDNYQ